MIWLNTGPGKRNSDNVRSGASSADCGGSPDWPKAADNGLIHGLFRRDCVGDTGEIAEGEKDHNIYAK